MPSTTFTQTFTSEASTSNQTDTVLTADPGLGLDIDWVGIAIESGAGSAVDVQVFVGDNAIAPQDDPIDIAGEFIELPTDALIGPGTDVVARHSNTSTTARDVTVVIAGDEQRGGNR